MNLSKSQKKSLTKILSGGLIFLFVISLKFFITLPPTFEITLLGASYIILGYDIFLKAFKNIKSGRVFDENFLMCIATIGAYILRDYTEAVAVMLLFQAGEFFQSYAVGKSRRAIKDLMDICPEYANIERDGVLYKVSPYELEPGDIINALPGEKIAIDGIIEEGSSSLDMASLTGESMPVSAAKGDRVLSGSINLESLLKIRVTKYFEESTASKIMELIENSGFNKAQSEKFITRFSSVYTPFVVICAFLTAFIPPLFLGSLSLWIKRALVFLVISCPCALVISVPLSFFAAIGCASKKGILIKGANYLELLGKAETIVFDKTGTLTQGDFEITKISPENCNEKELLEWASAAEFYSSHPLAKALKNKMFLINPSDIENFENISGLGVCADYKDKKIYAGNLRLMKELSLNPKEFKEAGTAVYIASDGMYMGYIAVSDCVKKDAFKTIAEIKKLGIKTCMLTGDRKENANYTAKLLGIDKVYSSLLPQDKVKKLEDIIKEKQNKNKAVIYVGDGINDAPVIAVSDVGIAMGSLGSDAAIEAADIVITDDKLSKIITAGKISKKANAIVRENVIFAIGTKALVMILGVFGFASLWAAVFADVGVAFIAILNAMRGFRE